MATCARHRLGSNPKSLKEHAAHDVETVQSMTHARNITHMCPFITTRAVTFFVFCAGDLLVLCSLCCMLCIGAVCVCVCVLCVFLDSKAAQPWAPYGVPGPRLVHCLAIWQDVCHHGSSIASRRSRVGFGTLAVDPWSNVGIPVTFGIPNPDSEHPKSCKRIFGILHHWPESRCLSSSILM